MITIFNSLFVTILHENAPSDPLALWLQFCDKICDDLCHALHNGNICCDPTEEHVFDYGLYLIDHLLCSINKTLADWPTMPQPQEDWDALIGNWLIAEQCNYDMAQEEQVAAQQIPTLNAGQHSAFDLIVTAVMNKTGQSFFLYGPGETGKTYVLSAIIFMVRGKLSFVLHLLGLLHCFWLEEGLPIHSLKSQSKSLRVLPAVFGNILIWLSWYASLIWLSGMRLQCNTVTFMKLLIIPSMISATMISHLVVLQLSLVETSNKFFQLLSKGKGLRLLVLLFSGLSSGHLLKSSDSQKICG